MQIPSFFTFFSLSRMELNKEKEEGKEMNKNRNVLRLCHVLAGLFFAVHNLSRLFFWRCCMNLLIFVFSLNGFCQRAKYCYFIGRRAKSRMRLTQRVDEWIAQINNAMIFSVTFCKCSNAQVDEMAENTTRFIWDTMHGATSFHWISSIR